MTIESSGAALSEAQVQQFIRDGFVRIGDRETRRIGARRRVGGCGLPQVPSVFPAVSPAGRASRCYRRLSFMMPERPLQLRECLPAIGGVR